MKSFVKLSLTGAFYLMVLLLAPTIQAQEVSKPSRKVPVALYSLVSPEKNSSVAGQQSGALQSATLKESSLETLKQRVVGESVLLPLAGQAPLEGKINLVQHEGREVRVAGELTNNAGSFALKNDGKTVRGTIQLPKTGDAYEFGVGAGHTALLRAKKLSEIICFPLPRMENEAPRSPLGIRQAQSIPVLNSRPSAVAQIYIDLDGETVTNYRWNNGNTIVAPAYALTSAEITEIFNRVKEDFWPFNINVTTSLAKYNSAPAALRVHCIVTPNDIARPGSGGVAYIGYFGTSVPCWVFNSSVVGISEAVSHEVGHTLGLIHDSQPGSDYYWGHTNPSGGGWAPLMGASYYQPTTQWSRGEYSSATNREDDLAIIASNGFGVVPDESGSTRATSAPISYSSAGVSKTIGIIQSASDSDYYAFSTSGGLVTFNAVGAQPSPNLDIRLQLEDSVGRVLASANPTPALDASLSATLTAGIYYIKVQGAGAPLPPATGYTTYGSIGAYTITGTIPGGTQRSAQATLLSPLENAAVTGRYALRAKTAGTAKVSALRFAYRTQPVTLSRNPVLGINDYSTVSDSLSYAGSAPLKSVMVSIRHTYLSDVTVTLIGPDGTRRVLYNAESFSGEYIHDTYDVSQQFLGKSTSGQWRLEVSDDSGGDVGTLIRWSLNFQSSDWTEIATDSNGVDASQEWTATWDTSKLLTGRYEVRATPVTSSVETASADVNSPINVTGYTPPSIRVSDVAIAEGNSATKTATFTLNLSARTFETVTARVRSANLTATAGKDYVAIPATTISFAPGETTKTIVATINGDVLDEENETFSVLLDQVIHANVADAMGMATITDDDAAPVITLIGSSVKEGFSDSSVALVYEARLSAVSGRVVTAQYQTTTAASFPATPTYDYTALPLTTLTFAPGEMVKKITVSLVGDELDEENERVGMQLSAVKNATVGTLYAEGVILDEDAAPGIDSSDYLYVTEGDTVNVTAAFTVYLSQASGRTVTVKYATVAHTATADADFVAVPPTLLTFRPGQTSQTIKVAIKYDKIYENSEDFRLTLSSPVNAIIDANIAECLIMENDPQPSLQAANVSVVEGSSGTVVLPFKVTLSAPSSFPISVQYNTSNDSAVAGSDYTALPLTTLNFAPGETSKTINVTVTPDLLDEWSERFNLNFSEPVNAFLSTWVARGTILDDDTPPSISINDVSVKEGNAEARSAIFTLRLSSVSGLPVTVKWRTESGSAPSAMGGVDYAVQSQDFSTFEPGQTIATANVPIYGDTLDEQNETFQLLLGGPINATVSDSAGVATILDDDAAPSFNIEGESVYEGNEGSKSVVFWVTLSGPSELPVTIHYQTVDNTAKSGSDYTEISSSRILAPGDTAFMVKVPLVCDLLDEEDESFKLLLSGATNATIEQNSAMGEIGNDDSPPNMSISGGSALEGNGQAVLPFTVSLDAPSGKTISFKVRTVENEGLSTTASLDYTALGLTTLSFAPGETSKTVNVPIKADLLDEADEVVGVRLSAVSNAYLEVETGLGTIVDDDAAPAISVDNVSVTEGSYGQQEEAVFTVRLSAPGSRSITVNYKTAAGTSPAAQPGSDFELRSGILLFAVGQTTRTIRVPIYGDDTVEKDESFFLYLSAAVNATIATSKGMGIIVSDDAATQRVRDSLHSGAGS